MSIATQTQGNSALRLTRRGRFVLRTLPLVILMALIVTLALIVDVFGSAASASNSDKPSGAIEYTVGYGDTLWGIAGQLDLDSPRAEVVQRIGELNQLTGSGINVGDTLFVPASLGS